MSESINFNSISNMIYGISSMIYGIGASIDISVRSVLRESRPGFPARGHDSESKRKITMIYPAIRPVIGPFSAPFPALLK